MSRRGSAVLATVMIASVVVAGIAPTLLALGADVVYLAGPIQRDVFGGFR